MSAAAAVDGSSVIAGTTGGNGTIPAELSERVRERSAFWARELLRDGKLYFASDVAQLLYACAGSDSGLTDDAGGGVAAVAAEAAAAAVDASRLAFPNELDPPVADAFRLHSRPGAAKKIVLDFTGHTMRAGTSWRGVSNIGNVPIVTPPYDLDGNPLSLSSAERAAIVSIWRTVAEDYSAWDVDVTTEEPPGTDDQADASLVGIGTRVAVGKNNGWFDNAAGVAFIGSFGQSWSGPVAFVFNSFAPSVAVAVSHEIGHTFGLAHHGNSCAASGTPERSYYTGHGTWGAFCIFALLSSLFLVGGRRRAQSLFVLLGVASLSPLHNAACSLSLTSLPPLCTPPCTRELNEHSAHHGRRLRQEGRPVVQGRLRVRDGHRPRRHRRDRQDDRRRRVQPRRGVARGAVPRAGHRRHGTDRIGPADAVAAPRALPHRRARRRGRRALARAVRHAAVPAGARGRRPTAARAWARASTCCAPRR
jgi:hypothetical protein